MIGDALRAIVDLLKIKKDARKTDLEIDRLTREKEAAESPIIRASFDEVKQYDPKTRRIIDDADTVARRTPMQYQPAQRRIGVGIMGWVVLIVWLIFVVSVVVRLMTWLYSLVVS